MAITTKQPGDTITAADINDLQSQINNIQAGPSEVAFFLDGNVYVATNIVYRLMGSDATITRVWGRIVTAPSGADLQIDINLNGVSILNTVLTITDGTNSANTTDLATTVLSAGDWFSMDIDQIGSSTPGAKLAVTIQLS